MGTIPGGKGAVSLQPDIPDIDQLRSCFWRGARPPHLLVSPNQIKRAQLRVMAGHRAGLSAKSIALRERLPIVVVDSWVELIANGGSI